MAQVPPGAGQTGPLNISAANRAQYDTAFQISPIILKNGIAAGVSGGLLPISSLYPAPVDPDNAIRFIVIEGGTLLTQTVGMYPFANQAVAANATIQQPLTVSLRAIAPVNEAGGYLSKLHLFSALQSSLQLHNQSGGLYIIATPAFMYVDCLMTAWTDETPADNEQRQTLFQIDFIQPILTLTAAAAQENAFIQRVTSGGQFNSQPGWSGLSTAYPANLPGVTGALETFGGTLSNTGASNSPGGPLSGVPTPSGSSGLAQG